MRKQIKILIALFLISIVSYLAYNIVTNLQHKKEVAERIKIIPNFKLKTLDNLDFTQKHTNNHLYKLFIYYNSECDFCKSEAKQIYNNLEQLKNVQIIFVSHEGAIDIKFFAENNNLDKQNNIIFLEDEKLEFSKIFNAKTIPYMLLYAKDNKLIKKFRGATRIEKIINLLE